MADRIRVQIQFKKFLWACPLCSEEEWEDRPMEGGVSYEHICKNGHTFNQSGSNMKEYNGTVNYTQAEYKVLKAEDLAKDKQKPADDWIYSVKNPIPYVEPKVEDIDRMILEKQQEIASLKAQKAEINEK
jgi:hypothetical protein